MDNLSTTVLNDGARRPGLDTSDEADTLQTHGTDL